MTVNRRTIDRDPWSWMSRRAPTLAAVVALGASALLATTLPLGCRHDPAPQVRGPRSATPRRGGTLRTATATDLRSLDPATAFDSAAQPVIELLYAGLVDYDDEGHIVADLAERFEQSDGGRRWTFVLRPGLRMHDGAELTADDIKRSVERTLHPDTPCPGTVFFERIEGFEDYQARRAEHLSGVIVEGPRTVSFQLRAPDATFLSVLALPFLRPVCRSAGTRYQDSFQSKACGAGPFRLAHWAPGRVLRLERFDAHHDAAHLWLDAIELKFDIAKLTQRFLLERGELDGIFGEWDRPSVIHFRTHPEWSKYMLEAPSATIYGAFMNVEMPPFNDMRVRQAVAAAVNRPNYKLYLSGWAQVTGHLIPPGIPGYDPDFPNAQRFDLARARRLMAEAGYPYDPATGRGGWPTPIVYYAGEGEGAVRSAQVLQYDLAQIGIRLEIKETSFAQYLAVSGRPKTVTMGYTGWNLDFPDPADFFEPILSSKAINEEDSSNKAFYRNPRLDALLDRAHDELDPARRIEMYHEAESIVCEEAPWAFTHSLVKVELVQPWVRDYRIHPIWDRHLTHVWIDGQVREGQSARQSLGGPLPALVLPRAWPASLPGRAAPERVSFGPAFGHDLGPTKTGRSSLGARRPRATKP